MPPLKQGHASPSAPPSVSTMMDSPTSVITDVMSSVSGLSTIVGTVHCNNESPSSTHNDMLEQHRRHRIRHQLDVNDDDVTPQDLMGRLQRDPLRNFGSSLHGSWRDEENGALISRRLQEIESKKVSLHQKRVSLEQRLYDFVDTEKRLRVNPHSMSLNMTYSTCSLASPQDSLKSVSTSTRTPQTIQELLRPPTPSPNKHCQQNEMQMQPVFQNGDEMVQDYPWKDPRTNEIVYHYSGTLNTMKQPHGWGMMQFLDGQIYEGQVDNGYRWGMGTNTWPDGQLYCGEWDNHSRNGRGTHTWRDGRRVNGEWRGGHLNGRVTFSWPNGTSFEGECRMGKKHGRGTHTWASGKLYVGNFVNGKEEGFGSLAHGDWKYRGQFKAGKREGYGMQIWRNKTYDGEWSNNKAHGKGRIVWQNGSTYTGEFRMGKYHGLGVYLFPSGKKYVGSWEDGCKHGQGIYTWPSGKKYDGAYIEGLKEGYGRMTWPDGKMYCGSWKKGCRDGRGIQTNPDGSMDHCGLWRKDRPHNKEERGSPATSVSTNSIAGDLSVCGSARLPYQISGQNTSEEDIVIMESQSVANADESMNTGTSPSKKEVVPAASPPEKEFQPLLRLPESNVLAPELQTIPATPSKMDDDVSSIGTCDPDATPNFLLTPMERISL